MQLPDKFLTRIKNQLDSDTEFKQFIESYTKPKVSGLRANSIKISAGKLASMLPFLEERVPWCSDGFYFNEEMVRPAKHLYYYGGLYYIQEPSAMLPVSLLGIEKDDKVLDLCAAPGGKSLQIAAALCGSGLLVTNDIQPRRAKVLLKNVERYGAVNAIVLNENPERLTKVFSGFFDKILVDAPCSGEGMFRKDTEMVKEWSTAKVEKYVAWQREILTCAAKMLVPGGKIVYSTCTFSNEENERQIEAFLKQHPDFSLVKMERLWPHQVRGEGHFAALLARAAGEQSGFKPIKQRVAESKDMGHVNAFINDMWQEMGINGVIPGGGMLVERSGHILYESKLLPDLRGLAVLRSGWLLGLIEKGRFRPSQALAMGLTEEKIKHAVRKINFYVADESSVHLAKKYLRGDTLELMDKTYEKGYYVVCIDGYPLGWIKSSGGILKNEIPPGWRITDANE